MTRQDVADYLHVSIRQVDKMSDSGALIRIKVVGQIRYRPEQIDDYLHQRTVEPADEQAA